LLLLLSINLIICSIDRFPNVWKQIRLDNLQTPVSRIEKMSKQSRWSNTTSGKLSPSSIFSLFNHKGWKVTSKEVENGTLFFSQKNAWSRTGVYIVHVSILIIFIGAIIGALTGFKGSIMIPDLQSSSKIFAFDTGAAIDLGFEIQCNSFGIEFYKNGMPKEYRSSLTVLEGGKEILTKSIEVNSPLTYKG
ncbi:MAG: cytochrome c biogenesis protein ResB, partial [Bacteroidetes bacterium]|nr:cytochrome c biogenesis protein ResB [Bacteroidota bacterium]